MSIHEATPDSIVTIRGMEMTLASALSVGYVTKADLEARPAAAAAVAHQPYRAPAGPHASNAEVYADLEAGSGGPEPLPEGSEAFELEPLADEAAKPAIGQMAAGSSPELQMNAIEEVSRTGAISAGTIEAFASEMGLDTQTVTSVVEGGARPAFEAQAKSAVCQVLGSSDAATIQSMIDWAYSERRGYSNGDRQTPFRPGKAWQPGDRNKPHFYKRNI